MDEYDGLHWQVSIRVECFYCSAKRFDAASGPTEYRLPLKFNPDDDDLDELRRDFLEQLKLDEWGIEDLEVWDSYGRFVCPDCVRALTTRTEDPALEAAKAA